MESGIFLEKLPLGLASSSPPDVVFLWGNTRNHRYIREGLILDITDLAKEVEDELLPGVLDRFILDEKIWGLAHANTTHIGLYNKEIFAQYNLELPKTWAELEEVCQTLVDNGIIPFAFGQKDKWNAQHWLSRIVFSIADTDDAIQMVTEPNKYNNEDMIKAYSVLRDFAQKGYLNPEALSFDETEAHTLFYNQDAAMILIGSWNIPEFLDTLGSPGNYTDFEYAVFNIPGVNHDVIVGHNNGIGASSGTKSPEAAKKFLEYWVGYENSSYFIENVFEPIYTNKQALEENMDSFDYLTGEAIKFANNDELVHHPFLSAVCPSGGFLASLNDELQKAFWDESYTVEESVAITNDVIAPDLE